MVNTINEARTPGELAAWLRQWADGADASDHLDDNDARQLAEAIERVCAPGNAAAMREALEKFLDLARRGLAFFTSYRYTEEENDELEDAFANAKSALAAPARNCDRFATAEEARRAFESAHSHGIVHNLYTAAFDWLFKKAEGGASLRSPFLRVIFFLFGHERDSIRFQCFSSRSRRFCRRSSSRSISCFRARVSSSARLGS